jgi:excisionase family DNA binding protein
MVELTITTTDLVTFAEAAEILKVSRPTVYNRVKHNRLHTVEIGKNKYLLRAEVEKLDHGR